MEKDGSCVHVCVHERKEEGKVSDCVRVWILKGKRHTVWHVKSKVKVEPSRQKYM